MPARDNNEEDRQYDDMIALQSGDLPAAIIDRLNRARAAGAKPFSSTLSVGEFLATRSAGLIPLGQVMGTAFVPMPSAQSALSQNYSLTSPTGLANLLFSTTSSSIQPLSGELIDLSYFGYEARRLAIQRMEKEAELLGASCVVGARLTRAVRSWGTWGKRARMLEFTIIGTAVHVPEMPPGPPFSSLLTGQEFLRLWQAGFAPRGIAIGVCSYTDYTDWSSIYQRSYNQEVAAYTQCFYEARRLAMEQFTADLRRHHAIGGIGVEIDYEFEDAESEQEVYETKVQNLHLVTHFAVLGTAVTRRDPMPPITPLRPLVVYDLRKKGSAEINLGGHKQKQPKE